MSPDFVNGLFELAGAMFTWANVIRVHKDKQVHGVSWIAVMFFTVWGYWNVYYYPVIGQPWSAACAIGLAVINTVWLTQLIYYDRRKQ